MATVADMSVSDEGGDPRFLGFSSIPETESSALQDEETYSSTEAGKILRYSGRQIQNLVRDGKLTGSKDDQGRLRVSARSVHAMKDTMPRRRRPAERPEWPVEAEDLIEKVQTLERLLGRIEGERHVYKELTEKTESTLREQLDRERERADRLENELLIARAAQSRGFWSRLFGG